MTIEEVFAGIEKDETEYNLIGSDFAITDSEANNRLVTVKLMQRNTIYKDCILMGTESVGKGIRGVLMFVGKTKYPVFVPLFYANNSNTDRTEPGTIRIQPNYPNIPITFDNLNNDEKEKLNNIKEDAVYVYSWIKQTFPNGNFSITSSYRPNSTGSEHQLGYAIDLSCPESSGRSENNPAPYCILDDIASFLSKNVYNETSYPPLDKKTYKIVSNKVGQMFWRCNVTSPSKEVKNGSNHYNHLHFSVRPGTILTRKLSHVDIKPNGNIEFICEKI